MQQSETNHSTKGYHVKDLYLFKNIFIKENPVISLDKSMKSSQMSICLYGYHQGMN
jgi:hypothetical protein